MPAAVQNGLEHLRKQLQTVATDSQTKRRLLLIKASHRSRLRRVLHVTAGILALLSATSITAIITELTNSMAVKVFSAAVAFISGVISLVISNYVDERDTWKMFEGAARFMSVRSNAELILSKPNVTDAELRKLHEEYGKCSTAFDPLIGFDESDLSHQENDRPGDS